MTPLRFAALGDSLTAGFGDPLPGGRWRGWAALLAPGLTAEPHGTVLLNCSRSGALTSDVAGEQLDLALSHRPHLASVLVGVNDTLRGSFDIEAVAQRLDDVFGALHTGGTDLLTACLPDPGRMLRLPWPLARPLGRRMRAVNQVVHALSDRYGAVHLHTVHHPWIHDRAAWSADRLHPSELGHRLLAREFHALLTAAGLADGEPPPTTLDGPSPGRAANAYSMATSGIRWVRDRCQDLLPDLLRLAAAECHHRAAGTTAVLELTAHRATVQAMASVGLRPGPNGSSAGKLTSLMVAAADGPLRAAGPAYHLRDPHHWGDRSSERPFREASWSGEPTTSKVPPENRVA